MNYPLQKDFFKANVAAFVIGLTLLYPLIGHSFTGQPERQLTIVPLLLHIAGLAVFSYLYFYSITKTLKKHHLYFSKTYLAELLIIPQLMFWIGFYLFTTPIAILLMTFSVARINGVVLKDNFIRSNRWMAQNIVAAGTALLAAAVVTYPLSVLLMKNGVEGLALHLSIGLSVSICIGTVYGLMTALFLKELAMENLFMESKTANTRQHQKKRTIRCKKIVAEEPVLQEPVCD